jgi:hypothetical protein
VYPALLPLMRTPRLPVVGWTDAPADLNGLVLFAERRNLVSTRVPSHFKRSLTSEPSGILYDSRASSCECKGWLSSTRRQSFHSADIRPPEKEVVHKWRNAPRGEGVKTSVKCEEGGRGWFEIPWRHERLNIASKILCVITGFRREVAENCVFLGYYATSCGNTYRSFGTTYRSSLTDRLPRNVGKKLSLFAA